MKLTDHFHAAFDAVVRSRGAFYAESGRVRHMNIVGDEDFLEAEVSGSGRNRYDVFLDWKEADRGVFLANCSCPHFEDPATMSDCLGHVPAFDHRGFFRFLGVSWTVSESIFSR